MYHDHEHYLEVAFWGIRTFFGNAARAPAGICSTLDDMEPVALRKKHYVMGRRVDRVYYHRLIPNQEVHSTRLVTPCVCWTWFDVHKERTTNTLYFVFSYIYRIPVLHAHLRCVSSNCFDAQAAACSAAWIIDNLFLCDKRVHDQ